MASSKYWGSGACASFLFGLILGRTGKDGREDRSITWELKPFCGELTFFARTFFFVLLGLLFSLSGVRDIWTLIAAIALMTLGLLFVRWSSISLTAKVNQEMRRDTKVMTMVVARGLGTALLATLPFHIPEFVNGTAYYALMSPFQGEFVNIAFVVIAVTIVLTGIGTGMRVGGLSTETE